MPPSATVSVSLYTKSWATSKSERFRGTISHQAPNFHSQEESLPAPTAQMTGISKKSRESRCTTNCFLAIYIQYSMKKLESKNAVSEPKLQRVGLGQKPLGHCGSSNSTWEKDLIAPKLKGHYVASIKRWATPAASVRGRGVGTEVSWPHSHVAMGDGSKAWQLWLCTHTHMTSLCLSSEHPGLFFLFCVY